MENNQVFLTQIKIIINNSLYAKNIIDEDSFIKVNEILLSELRELS